MTCKSEENDDSQEKNSLEKEDLPKEKGELLDVEDEIDSMKIEELSPRRLITAKRPSKVIYIRLAT